MVTIKKIHSKRPKIFSPIILGVAFVIDMVLFITAIITDNSLISQLVFLLSSLALLYFFIINLSVTLRGYLAQNGNQYYRSGALITTINSFLFFFTIFVNFYEHFHININLYIRDTLTTIINSIPWYIISILPIIVLLLPLILTLYPEISLDESLRLADMIALKPDVWLLMTGQTVLIDNQVQQIDEFKGQNPVDIINSIKSQPIWEKITLIPYIKKLLFAIGLFIAYILISGIIFLPLLLASVIIIFLIPAFPVILTFIIGTSYIATDMRMSLYNNYEDYPEDQKDQQEDIDQLPTFKNQYLLAMFAFLKFKIIWVILVISSFSLIMYGMTGINPYSIISAIIYSALSISIIWIGKNVGADIMKNYIKNYPHK